MPTSCFISYSSENQVFAEKLHADLIANDCEAWFAPESLRMGDRFQEGIEDAIRQYDKVIVVVSEASLKSRWVEREVLAARDREDTENRAVLIPIKIDDSIAKAKQPWAAEFRRIRQIGDFTKWMDADAHHRALARLLRDLKTERPRPSAKARRLPQDQLSRNRRQMIARVRHDWIDGILNQSLCHLARIDLALADRPDMLDRPLTLLVQEAAKSPQMLPARTKILSVFDQHADAGGLLILGAPGSGKTTLLLELARELLFRAEEDETHLIPVVFNLSSWAVRRVSLQEWLVDELNRRYTVPRKLAQQWVDDEQILPLLDGLDEVAAEHQQACVERINEFRSKQFLPVAVCSRIREYETLAGRLNLPAAVSVQPLTQKETQNYLVGGGERFVGIRDALARDQTLWELLDSPLMLSIAMLAYRDAAVEEGAGESLERRRQQLWSRYVKSMFQRRAEEAVFMREQTLQWLSWLASSMVRLNQSVFELEALNHSWLQTQRQQRSLQRTRLVGGLVGGLFVGLVGGLIGGLFIGLVEGLIGGLIGGLWGGLNFTTSLDDRARLKQAGLVDPAEQPAYSLRWSLPSRFDLDSQLGADLVGMLGVAVGIGLFGGLGIGLVGALFVGKDGGLFVGKVGGLGIGLVLYLVFGLFLLLDEGLVVPEVKVNISANDGTWRSGRNALFVGLVGALIVGLVGGLVGALVAGVGLVGALVAGVGLVFGLPFVLGTASFKGGGFFLQHWCMRLLLWRYGNAPFQYLRFLDYAAERILLRKVGGGYIFIHRMLLDYFASLPQPQHDSGQK